MRKNIVQISDFVYNDSMEQQKRGIAVSIVGIILNLLLAGGKIAVGMIFSLVSVVADGVNNLSDCGSGIVLLVSMRIKSPPIGNTLTGISARNTWLRCSSAV